MKENENFDLRRSKKNSNDGFDSFDDSSFDNNYSKTRIDESDDNYSNNKFESNDDNNSFDNTSSNNSNSYEEQFGEKLFNEDKLKKNIAIGAGITILVLVIIFMFMGGKKYDMFNAKSMTKNEVIAKFKVLYGKTLTEGNFSYDDAGNKVKKGSVYQQNPPYGSKFEDSLPISSFVFTVNKSEDSNSEEKNDDSEEIDNKEDTNSDSKEENEKVNSYVVGDWVNENWDDIKSDLENKEIEYDVKYVNTNSNSKDGKIASVNYLPKTKLENDSKKLEFRVWKSESSSDDKDSDSSSSKESESESSSDKESKFEKDDLSNPNVKKDNKKYWSWKQGDKVDFSSYHGDVPDSCYKHTCYYTGNGKPTDKTLQEQLGQ